MKDKLKNNKMSDVLVRFLRYVKIDTQSDSLTGMTPSTPGQYEFANALVDELIRIGLSDAIIDENGYVMATLPSNVDYETPVVGFIAHMDTSPDFTGKHIKPSVVDKYSGGDIVLDKEQDIVLSPKDFPELTDYTGQDIVVTNGKTLLGADDKAGLSEIVTAMEYLVKHPEIKHGKVRIGFTPDEEIGAGADQFNVPVFGADWAYTMDGGAIGELEFENFNAASAKIIFKGRNVHPGYAKHKMRNSMRIANQFISMIPRFQTPEHTEDYEGFFHLVSMNGNVEESTLDYIIRDHSRERYEDRKKEIVHLVNKINNEFGQGTASVTIKDQYFNMREKIEPVMFIVDIAREAMEEADVKPHIRPIRGGTDGARLSYMGLPCPNIFGGGHNFHGRFEFVPVQSMEKAIDVIVGIVRKVGLIKR